MCRQPKGLIDPEIGRTIELFGSARQHNLRSARVCHYATGGQLLAVAKKWLSNIFSFDEFLARGIINVEVQD
jgi:hypothetical protein